MRFSAALCLLALCLAAPARAQSPPPSGDAPVGASLVQRVAALESDVAALKAQVLGDEPDPPKPGPQPPPTPTPPAPAGTDLPAVTAAAETYYRASLGAFPALVGTPNYAKAAAAFKARRDGLRNALAAECDKVLLPLVGPDGKPKDRDAFDAACKALGVAIKAGMVRAVGVQP